VARSAESTAERGDGGHCIWNYSAQCGRVTAIRQFRRVRLYFRESKRLA
jgi:hypothetical protein